ncbi:amino acid adenylation domain-containing protein [Geodermatophilus sp. CPCC 205506]|uniref:amino acid adenylation domain-containing protein n=1 Tax=Geodermatophilus sp. CPCC 205506 TaxID=2936596 RepID=UPI003EECA92A
MSHHLIDGLLADAGQRWPDATAVRAESASLTYAELDTAADRVAGALADMGVARGDRVALHVSKSVEALAALYGIMRAGAAYVPIDPGTPPARGALIARDCEIAALVTDDAAGVAALGRHDPDIAVRGIVRTGDAPPGFATWDSVQSGAQEVPRRRVIDTDLAYILYTSGSTGRPKGVMISHRNGLTFVDWAHRTLGLRPDDVLSNHAPFHFDLSTFDLFGAASAGATVTMVPAVTAIFPVELARWIRAQEVTVWYSAPSALMLLVRSGDLENHPIDTVRLLLFAGEVFPTKYLGRLMRLAPRARYVNMYGPTETNVCTFHEVVEPPEPEDPPVPIGRACDNTRCELVDPRGAVIEDLDVEGELVVRGSIVAQGYWGDPVKTAAGFTEPYTYRTGDIAYWSGPAEDPVLRFVGRRDHMVKIRGFRVELGEIEAVLNAHPAVEEAAAVAVPDDALGSRIVAFCVVHEADVVTDVLRLCRDRLPIYMVPQRIVPVDVLPRTSNGKVDRPRLATNVG